MDGLQLLLVNTGDEENLARQTAREFGFQSPVLLDEDEGIYGQYSRDQQSSFAPFPVHVLVDTHGDVRYLSRHSDLTALKAAVDAL